MPDSFDPYHRWLGIPPEKQPPNHYVLLAIEPLEDNADVIAEAADRQMAHLRTHQAGKHSRLCQKLLNEVAAARVCLLNPEKKAAYDAQLRAKVQSETKAEAARGPSAAPAGFAPQAGEANWKSLATASRSSRQRSAGAARRRLVVGPAVGAGFLLLLVLVVLAFKPGGGGPDEGLPQTAATPADQEPRQPSPPPASTALPKAEPEKSPADVPPAPTAENDPPSPEASPTPTSESVEPSTEAVAAQPPAQDPETVYLWELPDHGLYSWNNRPIRMYETIEFDGKPHHKTFQLTPRARSSARVRFALDGQYKRLRGAVGLRDSGYKPANPVSFRIAGDGDETLWESPKIDKRKVSHAFDVDVEGVKTLTLYVDNPGSGEYCKPIFIEPVLVPADGAPPEPGPAAEPLGPDMAAAATPGPELEPATPPATRFPVPPAAEQAKIVEQLDEIYQFSKPRAPAERRKLAGELHVLAGKYQGGSTEKLVLLRKTAEFAGRGGDAKLMVDALDAMGAAFQIDPLAAKQEALIGFASGTPDAEQIGPFVAAADPVIDRALDKGRLEVAVSVAEAAYDLTRQDVGTDLRKQAYDRRNEVRKLALAWKAIQDARAALAKNPDDAAANLTVGMWYCLERNDWEQGLGHLAKCGNPALQDPARQEITSPPTSPDAQVALADAWWDAAEAAEGPGKEALMRRAGFWYQQAEPKLTGLARLKVEGRLKDISQGKSPPMTAVPQPVVKTWEPDKVQLLGTLKGHTMEVRGVAFSADGALLASGSSDSTVRLWDLTTGQLRKTFPGEEGEYVQSVCFSPRSPLLAAGKTNKTVQLWDIATGQTRKLRVPKERICCVAFSPDGSLLATAGWDRTVRVWDVATGESRRVLEHADKVDGVAFSPDGTLLASASYDRTVRLWSAATGEVRHELAHTYHAVGVAFSPDGSLLASAGSEGVVRLWEVASGRLLRELEGHGAPVKAVAFSPDGRHLASGSSDKTIKLWDVETRRLERTLAGHTRPVVCVAFSPDGALLASGGSDKVVRLWGPSSGGE